MLKRLQEKLAYGNIYCGIEHTTLKELNSINLLLLKKQKNELGLLKKISVSTINELNIHIKEKQHAYLIINDAHVLSKRINANADFNKAVYAAFPNIKLEDFYVETYTNETDTFVNICRKDHIEGILKAYQEQKIQILNISLGNLISSQIIPYYKGPNIETSNAVISLENEMLTYINKAEEPSNENYTINGLQLHSASLNAFSGILSILSKTATTLSNYTQEVKDLKDNFQQQKLFENGLKFSLSFIFCVLLINFLVFSSYHDNINAMSAELSINQQYKQSLVELQTEVDKKKKIVDEINAAESNQVSLYLDKIAKSIPKSVSLNTLQFQPLNKSLKKNKAIKLDQSRIVLLGNSTKGGAFSAWIAALENLEWIEAVTVSDYGLNKKSVNEFELKIVLKT